MNDNSKKRLSHQANQSNLQHLYQQPQMHPNNQRNNMAMANQQISARNQNILEQSRDRTMSPPGITADQGASRPLSQSLIDKNIAKLDIDAYYFDHMDKDRQQQKQFTGPNQQNLAQSYMQAKQTMETPGKGVYRPNHSSSIMQIHNRHHQNSLANTNGAMHNKKDNQYTPKVPQFGKNSSVLSNQHSDMTEKQEMFVINNQHFKRSFNDVDYQGSVNDQSSNRNMMSFSSKVPPANIAGAVTSSIIFQPITPSDGLSPYGNDSTPEVSTPQKPIVPPAEYRENLSAIQKKQQAQMMKVSAPHDASTVQKNGAGGMNWFTSLSLSVSQLWTAPANNADDSKSGSQDVDSEVGEVIQQHRPDRRMSSNGEVPDDEEQKEDETIELENIDVIDQATRIHQGNNIRKKILFHEKGVTNKAAGAKRSLKASLISAQSYNMIESDSDQNEVDSETSSQQLRNDRENIISFTTSKGGGSPTKGKINQLNLGKNFTKRTHANSVQEDPKLSNDLAFSFSNLASKLVMSSKQADKVVNSNLKQQPNLSPQPKPTGFDQEHKSSTPMAPGISVYEDVESNNNNNRFGMLSRLYDRVVNSSQKNRLSPQNNKTKDNDEEFLYQPNQEEISPTFEGGRKINAFGEQEDESKQRSSSTRQIFGRPASKTVHVHGNERKSLLSMINPYQTQPQSQVIEKLRQIDRTVFNQDRSQYAVIWTDGGFTKFDVANLQVIQRVLKTPPSNLNSSDDLAQEITLVNASSQRQRTLNNLQNKQNQVEEFTKIAPVEVKQDDFESDEEDESEKEQFKCLALQHRTKDYLATLVKNPNMVIFVHIQDDPSVKEKLKQKRKYRVQQQMGIRTHVKHFLEEVCSIEILPGARYTLICLETAIYIYSKNSRDLYDIVPCSSPLISSAIYKRFEQKLVIAYLSKDDPEETVMVHDYSVNPTTSKETVFSIAKPFSAGYKIGGIQLDGYGQRVVVVSADGCYVYLYQLEEEQEQKKQEGQDQAAPQDGVLPSEDSKQDASALIVQHEYQNQVTVSKPQQLFKRSSSSCKEIYLPIQIVEGFSIKEHVCDLILISSSSMTTHIFVLKTQEELEETQLHQHEQSWTLYNLLPTSFSLPRSSIRLNISEELAPVHVPRISVNDGRMSQPTPADPLAEDIVEKLSVKDYPYSCFVEGSGLLVAISNSGYCCKFSIQLQSELSATQIQRSGFNTARASHHSLAQQNNSMAMSQVANLGQSLAQLVDLTPQINSYLPGGRLARGNSKVRKSQQFLTLDTQQALATSQAIETQQQQMTLQHQSVTSNTVSMKKATAFTGYQQPALNFKEKLSEFFFKIDTKAESLRRIQKRQIIQQRTLELKERALFYSQMQLQNKVDRSSMFKDQTNKKKLLKSLLGGNSSKPKKSIKIKRL